MESTNRRRIILGCAAVLLLSGLLAVKGAGGGGTNRLQRPTGTDSAVETVNWKTEGEGITGEGTIELVIDKQTPDEESILLLLEYGERYLREHFPDGCKVYGDIKIPEEIPGTKVKASFEASEYKYINIDGSRRTPVEKEEGEPLELTVTLSVYGREKTVGLSVILMPKEFESTFEQRLKEKLETLENSTNEAFVELPAEFEGVKLKWEKPKDYTWLRVLFLLPFVPVVVILLDREKKKNARKDYEKLLLREYPEVVSKFLLLLEAGLTVRAAFGHVVSGYAEKGMESPAAKELKIAFNEMENGISEATACENFGKRCGIMQYMRFAGLMSQNLTKGSESVFPLLEQEVISAFAERKENAKKAGEEAGTKLLIPMVGMLAVVLAMIMFSAFGNV